MASGQVTAPNWLVSPHRGSLAFPTMGVALLTVSPISDPNRRADNGAGRRAGCGSCRAELHPSGNRGELVELTSPPVDSGAGDHHRQTRALDGEQLPPIGDHESDSVRRQPS
jgi:hypothetical protein